MVEKFSKMMLVVDGTESSSRAARTGVNIATRFQAKIVAVAVVDTATLKYLFKTGILVEAETAEFDQQLETSAQAHLHYVAQLCKENNSECELILRKGVPHAIMAEELRRISPDLLIMGSFTSMMIKRDFNARTRRLVVDDAVCPILLIP